MGLMQEKDSIGALDCSNEFGVQYINTDDGIIGHNYLLNSRVLFLTNLKQPGNAPGIDLQFKVVRLLTGFDLKGHTIGTTSEIENEK